VPSFSQNLVISISILNKEGYLYSLGNKHRLYIYSKLLGTNSLSPYDNLYEIDMVISFNKSLILTHGAHKKIN
jgi:hypothetical protein